MLTHHVSWPEHWTNGGTAITRLLSEPTATQVRESVVAFNDPQIFLNEAKDEMHSTRKPLNLSDFWHFHYTRIGIKRP